MGLGAGFDEEVDRLGLALRAAEKLRGGTVAHFAIDACKKPGAKEGIEFLEPPGKEAPVGWPRGLLRRVGASRWGGLAPKRNAMVCDWTGLSRSIAHGSVLARRPCVSSGGLDDATLSPPVAAMRPGALPRRAWINPRSEERKRGSLERQAQDSPGE